MCQWGAKGMADEFNSYDRILATYYPGAELWRVYK
jgi:peptidoglycan hydrolase-like amidase